MNILFGLGAEPDNKTQGKSPKHESFYLGDVHIELHFLIERLRNPIYNKKFQPWVSQYFTEGIFRI